MEKLSRRTFLGLAAASAAALACNPLEALRVLISDPTPVATPQSEPTVCAAATATRKVEPTAKVESTPKATATKETPKSRISCEHVTDESLDRAVVFEGFPIKAIQVLSPRGDSRFKSTWTADLDMMITEPGILENPNRLEKIDKMPYPITTDVGGHTAIVFQEGIVEYQGRDGKIRKVELPELQGRTHMFIFREPFDTNNNKSVQLKVTCAVENHGQVKHFEKGAFVSEDQMGQFSLGVFTGRNIDGASNGNTANSMFTVTEVDWNTDAFAVGSQFGKGLPFVGERQNWK